MYEHRVFQAVLSVMQELGTYSRNKQQKIGKYHKLPAEIAHAFSVLEKAGVIINSLNEEDLKLVIQRGFQIIDRTSEYDQELMNKISPQELVRWRRGMPLENDESFYRIVETLKEHAVPVRPLTVAAQQPRVRFAPKGQYHKRQTPF